MRKQVSARAGGSRRLGSGARVERCLMRGLEGKVALVAGAAGGNNGGGAAGRGAEEGMSVVVADLNGTNAQRVVDKIIAGGGKAEARSFDISDESSYEELIKFTVEH